jgi:hypothetical protein
MLQTLSETQLGFSFYSSYILALSVGQLKEFLSGLS